MKFFVVIFALAFFVSPAAHAVCNSPTGAAGDQIYNSSHNVMQYCNGTHWIAMGSGGAGGGGSDTLGDLACATGESIEFDGTNWSCVGGKVSRAGDTMTGTLDVAAPTASTHATTKGYVDAAISMAVAGASGGGGTTCMYASNNCPAGWAQAGPDNNYKSDGVWHRICCMGGGSLLDEMPSTFDFPASPAIAYNAGHTWTPVEVTGFDSASVSITTTASVGTGEFRVCADSSCSNVLKGWGTAATGIASGNYLQIRIGAHTNLRTYGAKITITVGGMTDVAEITPNISGNYFIAFATNATWRGGVGGTSGADTKCQAAADAAGLGGTYRAWISDTSSSPSTRFENINTSAAFLMPGTTTGYKIADNWADLVDGTLDSAFNRSETGVSVTGYAWANTVGGAVHNTSYHCLSWASNSSTERGFAGNVTAVNSSWYYGDNSQCNDYNRLYCLQTALPN